MFWIEAEFPAGGVSDGNLICSWRASRITPWTLDKRPGHLPAI